MAHRTLEVLRVCPFSGGTILTSLCSLDIAWKCSSGSGKGVVLSTIPKACKGLRDMTHQNPVLLQCLILRLKLR